ncbi:MAG: hypothetical protein GY842_21760, partial [bacterium]|nr:hypothetical protein [bacterium]
LRLSTRARRAAETKLANAQVKRRERGRRDQRMLAAVQSGTLPYTPDVMSWLSRRLDKPSTRITAEDIATLTR